MIVKKQFYCIQEKKTYYVGNVYNGKRKDLKDYLEQIEVIAEVVKPKSKKNKK